MFSIQRKVLVLVILAKRNQLSRIFVLVSANQIQVSETTYQLLCRHIAYNLGKSGFITTEVQKKVQTLQHIYADFCKKTRRHFTTCFTQIKHQGATFQELFLPRQLRTSICTTLNSWEILLLFNSRRISVSRRNFVTLLLLFCFQTNKNIKVYTLNGRRVSEDVTARDCPGKRTAWMPIQLEQKALYRYIC